MKTIILLGAALVGGEMRFPAEGPLEATADEARDLIDVGLAKAASLSSLSIDELRETAETELVDVAPDAAKADLIAAITAARAGA